MSTFQVLDVPRTNPYFKQYFAVVDEPRKKSLKISSFLVVYITSPLILVLLHSLVTGAVDG